MPTCTGTALCEACMSAPCDMTHQLYNLDKAASCQMRLLEVSSPLTSSRNIWIKDADIERVTLSRQTVCAVR